MNTVAPSPASKKDCLVCGGSLKPSHLPGLLHCSRCGFITANINISDDELAKLYGRDYFHGSEYFDYIAEAECLKLNFRRRINVLKSLDPKFAERELFEIGCAYGFFLKEVDSEIAAASGIDISADAVAHAISDQKVKVGVADYLSHDLERPVDIIAMWDTVEHLKHPDRFIAKAAQDLKPGGLLAITTGDISSLNARMRGKSWRMIHPPTHLHYFSVATLTRLLDAKGFDVVHVSHPGNSRKLRSVLYFLTTVKGDRKWLYDSLQHFQIFDLAVTVNLLDIMYVVGRKRGSAAAGPEAAAS